LILDTSIELNQGARYGLIGSNGSGKSSFLKCLAAREVPIPSHIDIFLLEREADPLPRTGLECVIDDARAEVKRLEALSDSLLEQYGPECELLQGIYDKLDSLNPETFEARAARILFGLGFDAAMMKKHTKDMSGGWRMRVALAKALFIKPSLLLLDEPTNHLDLGACVWLEEYLATYDKTLVVVSHSQDFLNGVCTNIMHLDHKRKLTVYGGNYDQFVQTKAENEVNQMKRYHKEQEDIAHIKSFIASCGTYSNLVRQAKSKQKILDKMYEQGLTEIVEAEHQYEFKFPVCDKLPTPVVAFDDVAFAYSGKWADILYKDVNIGLSSDSRVAIVGPNGAGKSTLLKLILNDITPTKGDVRRHSGVSIGRYHQHSCEAFDPTQTPLDFFRTTYAHENREETEWRAFMGKFGITGT
jgi:ATP-binding cassette subfamily F protein 2